MHFIQIQNITKQFSKYLALDNVSFEVKELSKSMQQKVQFSTTINSPTTPLTNF
jgi:ABC-type uncharacterized transport system ATPase subunit